MAENKQDEIYEYIEQIKQLEGEVIRLNKVLADMQERNKGIKQSYEGLIDFQTAIVQLRRINDPVKIIKEFLLILRKFLPYDGYYIFTNSHKWKDLSTGENISKEYVLSLESDGIFEWVMNSGHPIVLPANKKDMGNTNIIIPLRAWDEEIGAILINSPKADDSFSAFDLELLNLMATQTAQSAQNAYLFAEVHRTRDFLDRVINSYSDFIINTDEKGRITFSNKAFKKCFTEIDEENFITQNMKWGETSVQGILNEIADTNKMLSVENEVLIGGEYSAYRWLISRMEQRDSRNSYFLWIGTNLKEEKKRESEKLQAEKLKTVIQVARSVSHEINSPLTAVMGHLELLLLEDSFDDDTIMLFNSMLEDLKRIHQISLKLEKVKEITTQEYYKGNKMISLK